MFRTEAISATPACGVWALLAAPTAGVQAHSGYCPAPVQSLDDRGLIFWVLVVQLVLKEPFEKLAELGLEKSHIYFLVIL